MKQILSIFNYDHLISKALLLTLVGIAYISISSEIFERYHLTSYYQFNYFLFTTLLARLLFIILFMRLLLNAREINFFPFYIKILLIALIALSFLHFKIILFKNTLYMIVLFLNTLIPLSPDSYADIRKINFFWIIIYTLITINFYMTFLFQTDLQFWNIDLTFSSFFPHRNSMTNFYILSIIVIIFSFNFKNMILFIANSLPIIFFSYSRSALISFTLISCYIVYATAHSYKLCKIIILISASLVILKTWENINSPLVPSNVSRALENFNKVLENRDFSTSDSFRKTITKKTIDLISKKPLWGHGEYIYFKQGKSFLPPHNFILSNIYAYGLIYSALMLTLIVITFIKSNLFSQSVLLHIFVFSLFQPYFDTFTSINSILFLGIIIIGVKNKHDETSLIN